MGTDEYARLIVEAQAKGFTETEAKIKATEAKLAALTAGFNAGTVAEDQYTRQGAKLQAELDRTKAAYATAEAALRKYGTTQAASAALTPQGKAAEKAAAAAQAQAQAAAKAQAAQQARAARQAQSQAQSAARTQAQAAAKAQAQAQAQAKAQARAQAAANQAAGRAAAKAQASANRAAAAQARAQANAGKSAARAQAAASRKAASAAAAAARVQAAAEKKAAAMEAAAAREKAAAEKASAATAAAAANQASALDRLRNTIVATGIVTTAFWAGNRFIGGIENATTAAIDFETKLSSVRKTTGLSGQGLEVLRGKLTDLATSFGGFKIGELFDVAAMGGRLGIAGNKIADFARDIGMIRVALEDIPAEQAATDIARILNTFKLGADQTINFASALNKLDDTSTATGRDILDITQRIAGSAQTLGLAPQKVLALAAALKDAGVENEVAGTAISQVFGRMSTHADKFAEVAGVGFQKFANTLRADPLAALQLFERGLRRLDGATQLQVLEHLDLDGMRVKGTLLQLANTMDKIPGYIRAANGEWQSLDSILKENNVAGNTTEGQLNRMRAAYEKIAMQIGEHTLPIVKSFAGSMVELSGNLGGFLKANEGTFANLSEWFTRAARSAGLIVTNFGMFARLAKEFTLDKFESMVTIFQRIGGQIGANLSAGVDNGIQLIRNAFEGLGTFIESFFIRTGKVAAFNMAKSFADMIPDKMKTAIGLINPLFGESLKLASKMDMGVIPPPDTSGFSRQALGKGLRPMPGFSNPLANLPQNEHGEAIVAILGEIKAARAKVDSDASDAKKAQLPVGNPAVTNPFAKMTPAQRGAAQSKLTRQRALLASRARLDALAQARKPAPKKGKPGARRQLPDKVQAGVAPAPNAKKSPLQLQQEELAKRQELLTKAQDDARQKAAEAAANRAANAPVRAPFVGPPAPRMRPPGWRGRPGANDQADAGAPNVEGQMVGVMGGMQGNAQRIAMQLNMLKGEVAQLAQRLTENKGTNLTQGHA